jgi:hypothetical protein
VFHVLIRFATKGSSASNNKNGHGDDGEKNQRWRDQRDFIAPDHRASSEFRYDRPSLTMQ